MKKTIFDYTGENTILLDKFDMFFNKDAEHLSPMINVDRSELPQVIRNFKYPVSSWPIMIDSGMSKTLEKLSVRLPELLYRIPKLYFDDRTKDIADFYFKGKQEFTEFALACHNKNVEVSCRLDLTLTDDGFRVLEINTGSSIGGWQLDNFETIVRDSHRALKHDLNFRSRRIQFNYIEFLVNKVTDYVSDIDDHINIFIAVGEGVAMDVQRDDFFGDLLRRELVKRDMKGEVYIHKASSLEYANKHLYLGEERIHCVLMMDYGSEYMSPELLRAHIMGAVYFPDHMGAPLLRDKRNLTILRELAKRGKFDPEDNDLILSAIPWTAIMKISEVVFKGKKYDLISLLKDNKDQFVIKTANGFRGESVFVGKFLKQNEWNDAILRALGEEAFIAQEYMDSRNFSCPNKFNEWEPHKLVWGAFGFGEIYGGVIVRMTNVNEDEGIISASKGAILGIVYENEG